MVRTDPFSVCGFLGAFGNPARLLAPSAGRVVQTGAMGARRGCGHLASAACLTLLILMTSNQSVNTTFLRALISSFPEQVETEANRDAFARPESCLKATLLPKSDILTSATE